MVCQLGIKWLGKKNGEIKNLDLVKEVCWLHKQSHAKIMWVRGHVGNICNEMADVWANKAREERTLR